MQYFFIISSDHPALSGHFPGHPVVPAVVLLQQLENLVLTHYPNVYLSEMQQAKFMQLVFPNESIQIQADQTQITESGFKIAFRFYDENDKVRAKGVCLFAKRKE